VPKACAGSITTSAWPRAGAARTNEGRTRRRGEISMAVSPSFQRSDQSSSGTAAAAAARTAGAKRASAAATAGAAAAVA
jgi:hypothetical protein